MFTECGEKEANVVLLSQKKVNYKAECRKKSNREFKSMLHC